MRDNILSDKRYSISVLYRSVRLPHLRANRRVYSPHKSDGSAKKGKATRSGFARSSCVTNAGKYHQRRGRGG
ncbi:hypothetical protein GT037_005915 [Alternaria burnsii]|uniref:Uncharacterized protein n=1 Tax=Alternaria burnsii TaxID=1187904 RepID=A0A8H7BBU4_9PLEO|nr:uncharacterized protein GT037_005915 [Alternaria burnsii]KAF7676410.1 hypothetical protein GT037_005915 [Alternaria burnsii]